MTIFSIRLDTPDWDFQSNENLLASAIRLAIKNPPKKLAKDFIFIHKDIIFLCG